MARSDQQPPHKLAFKHTGKTIHVQETFMLRVLTKLKQNVKQITEKIGIKQNKRKQTGNKTGDGAYLEYCLT
jgi:hypothetical protein